MASSFPARQIPAMFARRQQPTRVYSAARREFTGYTPGYRLRRPTIRIYRMLTRHTDRLRIHHHPDPEPRLPPLPIRHPTPPRKGHPRLRYLQDPRLRPQGPSLKGRRPRLPRLHPSRLPLHPSRSHRQARPPRPEQHQDRSTPSAQAGACPREGGSACGPANDLRRAVDFALGRLVRAEEGQGEFGDYRAAVGVFGEGCGSCE